MLLFNIINENYLNKDGYFFILPSGRIIEKNKQQFETNNDIFDGGIKVYKKENILLVCLMEKMFIIRQLLNC